MQLRGKVLKKIKAKTLNGKRLNGEMLYNLSLSYIEAINKGAVPNIESAWSYICRNECQKAIDTSMEKFERHMGEEFEAKQPMFDDELKELYVEAKKKAMEDFGSVAVGDIRDEFMIQLK